MGWLLPGDTRQSLSTWLFRNEAEGSWMLEKPFLAIRLAGNQIPQWQVGGLIGSYPVSLPGFVPRIMPEQRRYWEAHKFRMWPPIEDKEGGKPYILPASVMGQGCRLSRLSVTHGVQTGTKQILPASRVATSSAITWVMLSYNDVALAQLICKLSLEKHWVKANLVQVLSFPTPGPLNCQNLHSLFLFQGKALRFLNDQRDEKISTGGLHF